MKRLATLLVTLLLVLGLMTGCTAKGDSAMNLVLITSPHQHSGYMFPDLEDKEIAKIINSCANGGNVSLVTIEGNPKIHSIGAPAIDASKSRSRQAESLAAYIDGLSDAAASYIATSEEADVLKAIILAARSIPEGLPATIVISAPMIQTAGAIDMRSVDIGSIDIDLTIAKLKDEMMVPDLGGVNVIIYGLGDIKDLEINEKDRDHLERFWKTYFDASGAKAVFDHKPYSGGEIDCVLPHVSEIKGSSTGSLLSTGFLIDESSFPLFKPDSTDFTIGIEDVYEVLDPVLRALDTDSSIELLICGTTATAGSYESSVELSKRRADEIATVLRQNGAMNTINTLGLGYDNPYHLDDIREDGSLDPDIAKRNRAVVILDMRSEMAKILYNDYS